MTRGGGQDQQSDRLNQRRLSRALQPMVKSWMWPAGSGFNQRRLSRALQRFALAARHPRGWCFNQRRLSRALQHHPPSYPRQRCRRFNQRRLSRALQQPLSISFSPSVSLAVLRAPLIFLSFIGLRCPRIRRNTFSRNMRAPSRFIAPRRRSRLSRACTRQSYRIGRVAKRAAHRCDQD